MRPFFLRKHPCPECYGNAPWAAEQCPHCKHPLGASDRFEWLPAWMKGPAFLLMVSAFSFTGHQAAGGLVIVWAVVLGVY